MTKRRNFTPKTKAQSMLNCSGKCVKCGDKLIKPEFDHRLPDATCKQHGIKSNSIDNCDPLCKGCHSKKTKNDMFEIAKAKRQNKKQESAADGVVSGLASPPKKTQWVKRKIQSRKFDKPKEGHKWRW